MGKVKVKRRGWQEREREIGRRLELDRRALTGFEIDAIAIVILPDTISTPESEIN